MRYFSVSRTNGRIVEFYFYYTRLRSKMKFRFINQNKKDL